jgi:hypothetical protein
MADQGMGGADAADSVEEARPRFGAGLGPERLDEEADLPLERAELLRGGGGEARAVAREHVYTRGVDVHDGLRLGG